MQGASAVCASGGVPAIAVAGNPRIDLCSKPANAGDEEKPRKQIPAWQKQTNVCPSFSAAPHVTLRIDRLHPTHRRFAIDLREAGLRGGIVQIQEFDTLPCVKPSQTLHTGAAEAAVSVVENSDLGHGRRPRAPYLI